MSNSPSVALQRPPSPPRRRPHPAKPIIVGEGRTLKDVADAVGVNHHTFGRVLNRRVPSWPALRERLAEHLGRTIAELFIDDDESDQ